MSAREKSDLPEVAEKRANKAVSAAAELLERRGGAKENAGLQSTVRTQSREAVSQAQARIREAVIRNRQDKLTALLHHLTVDVLRASFFGLKKSAAPGVDEVTWTEYAEGLEENLSRLHSRVHTGAYRALPSRRTYIPKADGRQRPLGIAALEDKSSRRSGGRRCVFRGHVGRPNRGPRTDRPAPRQKPGAGAFCGRGLTGH
jgi:RNA-directed DNA polymerase